MKIIEEPQKCFGCLKKETINGIFCIDCFLILVDPIDSKVPTYKRIIAHAVNWADLVQVRSELFKNDPILSKLRKELAKEYMLELNKMFLKKPYGVANYTMDSI